ncbi:hypothetical protein M0804_006830 [Polistes exclamans]|nr:hypothetical protein M0804_006830 [Polistes exclamans]
MVSANFQTQIYDGAKARKFGVKVFRRHPLSIVENPGWRAKSKAIEANTEPVGTSYFGKRSRTCTQDMILCKWVRYTRQSMHLTLLGFFSLKAELGFEKHSTRIMTLQRAVCARRNPGS